MPQDKQRRAVILFGLVLIFTSLANGLVFLGFRRGVFSFHTKIILPFALDPGEVTQTLSVGLSMVKEGAVK